MQPQRLVLCDSGSILSAGVGRLLQGEAGLESFTVEADDLRRGHSVGHRAWGRGQTDRSSAKVVFACEDPRNRPQL